MGRVVEATRNAAAQNAELAAISVDGEAMSERAAQSPSPAGRRPSDPNQSIEITRASICSGTRCITIVSPSGIAKPRHAPRSTLSAAATANHGDRAKTTVAQLLRKKSE